MYRRRFIDLSMDRCGIECECDAAKVLRWCSVRPRGRQQFPYIVKTFIALTSVRSSFINRMKVAAYSFVVWFDLVRFHCSLLCPFTVCSLRSSFRLGLILF